MWNLDPEEPKLIKNQLKSPYTYTVWAILSLWAYAVFPTFSAFACVSLLAFIFTVHSLIDFKTFILPDRITYPGILLGLILPPLYLNHGYLETAFGFICGYGFFWLISFVYEKLRGFPGLGFGDVKLLGLLGAWCGVAQLPLILLISSLTGLVVIVLRSIFTHTKTSEPMPFGPFLCAGGWVTLLYPTQIWDAIIEGRMQLSMWILEVLS